MTKLNDALISAATVLAVSVLIDERLRDIEMVEFSHSMITINRHIRPDVILPRSALMAWFNENAAEISERISKDSDNVWKTEILGHIQDAQLRRMVLAAMFSISICDYELNDEECEYLKLAVSLWETGLPHIEDMELMAG